MAVKTLSDLLAEGVSGRGVLVRSDFNVPLNDDRQITDPGRIIASLPTLKALSDAGAKLVVTAHLGRPKGEPDPKFSLAPVARDLGERLGRHVQLAGDVVGSDALARAEGLTDGDILLLENIRFDPRETSKDDAERESLARALVELVGDDGAFVSDGFGVVHRKQASVFDVATLLPHYAGTLVATDAFEVRVALTEDEAALIPSLLRADAGRIPASVTFVYGGVTYRWDAFVDRADPILDPQTRTIDAFLKVPSPLRSGQPVDGGEDAPPGPPLLLGSFVEARIVGEVPVPFARIPIAALRPGNEIWVVREGRLRILPVRVIQRSDEIAYVTTQSLAAGGRIVTSTLRAPTDGMRVRVAGTEKQRRAGQSGGE